MSRFRSSARVTAVVVALVMLAAFVGLSSAAGGGAPRWSAPVGITPDDISHPNDYYIVSFTGSGAVGPACGDPNGTIPYKHGDVVLYEGPNECWGPWFSATRSGLSAAADVNAMHDRCRPPFDVCDTYFSFKAQTAIPGVGAVQPQDVVVGSWDPDSVDAYENFQMVFDGSDVGLTTKAERIDGLSVFDPGDEPDGYDECAALLLISTAGAYRVSDAWGNPLSGGGEDVLGFCMTNSGSSTAGYWFLYHDGSAEGLPANALVGLDHQVGRRAFGRFELLTGKPIAVDAAHGGPSEVFNFTSQTGEYDGPTFSFPELTNADDPVDSFTLHEG